MFFYSLLFTYVKVGSKNLKKELTKKNTNNAQSFQIIALIIF